MSYYFHESMVAKMVSSNGYQQGYGVGFSSGYQQGRADKYQEIVSEYMLLTEEQVKEIRADVIEGFAHALKETFNNEFPSNYHCTQPYFTLDNVRGLTDLVAKEQNK